MIINILHVPNCCCFVVICKEKIFGRLMVYQSGFISLILRRETELLDLIPEI